MTRLTAAALLCLLALTPRLEAQDVMKVAKDHYKVLAENEFVRVIQNTLPPGASDPMHTHPAGWYIVTAPGKMKVVFATGKTEIWEPALNESAWSEPEGAHTSENVGSAPMSYILVEVKGVRRVGLAPRARHELASRGSH